MRYVSTRGQAPVRDFAGVLLAGLAEDGGLYVPESWPRLSFADWRAMRGLPYPALAARIMQPFVGDAMPAEALAALCHDAYAGFGHPAVVPLQQLETSLFVQELFHGPTLAFKDMALQVRRPAVRPRAGRARRNASPSSAPPPATPARRRSRPASAASASTVVFLHPHGRISEVQRRQMTTVHAANVGNIAMTGTFDDCQDLVKAMFADAPFRAEMHLSAMNSINWARIAAQVPYYAAAALALGAPDREVAFSVPTGNFGNVLAAWVARRMGLPVARLIVGSNRNDILARFLTANDMSMAPVEPSLSPSMDIQVSSNFERLLFELLDRDPVATADAMRRSARTGRMAVPDMAWRRARTAVPRLPPGRRGDRGGDPPAATQPPATWPIRTPPSASPPRAPCRRRRPSPWWRWPPRIRPSSPMRSSKPSAGGRRCRRAWPTCTTGRSAS